MHARRHRLSGFTLVELLIAIGIIAVLSAITYPVLAQAKRKSAQAVSASNLRQCGMALLMYSDEFGGLEHLPTRPAADEVLSHAPTCDPGDYFRSGCRAAASAPFIGSYAYVRDQTVYGGEDAWRHYLGFHLDSPYSPALLANLFVSSRRHTTSSWFGPRPQSNPTPDRIQFFESDGGARLYNLHSRPEIGYTWHTLFLKR